MILTSFLCFWNKDKLIKLEVFLKLKNIITNFLNPPKYIEKRRDYTQIFFINFIILVIYLKFYSINVFYYSMR